LSSFIFRAAGFSEIINLLKETNRRLSNMEVLLEFLLSPPDLRRYKKGHVEDTPRKKINGQV